MSARPQVRLARLGSRALLGAALIAGFAACQPGEMDDDAQSRAEQSRADTLKAARTVLDSLAADAGGRVSRGSGGYRACGEDVDASASAVEYAVRARVDVSGAGSGRSLLASAPAALTAAGFEDPAQDQVSGGSAWTASKDQIGASVTQRADSPWLIVDLRGPCVEVDNADALIDGDRDDLTAS